MKQLMSTLLLLLTCVLAQAQTLDEWIRQKKTQKKYLLQQIAALKVYTGFLQKSYKVAKDGLSFIGDIKDREFSLHKSYFQSLDQVNPVIRKYSKADQIPELYKAIKQVCTGSLLQLQTSDALTTEEMLYIRHVYDRLLAAADQINIQLHLLTSNHQIQLSDAQRLSRIEDLFVQMQEQYSFLKQFSDESMSLALSRKNAADQIRTAQKLHATPVQ